MHLFSHSKVVSVEHIKIACCEGIPNIMKYFIYSFRIIKWTHLLKPFFPCLIYFRKNTHPETGALHTLQKVTSAPSFAPRNIRRAAVCSVCRGGGPWASVSSEGSSTPLWIPPHSLPSRPLHFTSCVCLQTLDFTSLANLWSGPHLGEYWCRSFIWDLKMCVTGGYGQHSSVSGSEMQHWNLCSFGLCLFRPSRDLSSFFLSLVESNSNSVLKMNLKGNKQNVHFHNHAISFSA